MSDSIAPATTFADRLRAATAFEHSEAERSPLLDGLAKGSLGVEAWLVLLEQYRAVYGALEEGVGRMPENHPAQELFSVELNRVDAIDADLAALRERTGLTPVGMLPATREYAERIMDASSSVPRFVAHHYTRYLGDLSGGRVMRSWLERTHHLAECEMAYFRFDGIHGPRFKRHYREALSAIGFDVFDEQRVIAEARDAFDDNRNVFDEVYEVVRSLRLARVA